MSALTTILAARAAVDRGDWQTALDALAGPVGSSAEGLELKAQAAYGAGDLEGCVDAWETLHALQLAADNRVEAARAAAMIALYVMMDTGLMSPVRGWLGKAHRLLEGEGDVPVRAIMAMVRTYERFMCGDMATAREQSELAIELGERLGVLPAVVIGRTANARITIFEGRVDQGLVLLDEVGALLMTGEVDALTTGMMYCEIICAAQGLMMHDRAQEWTEVMERWRHGAAFGGINGRCRVHRAELLRMSGTCDLAEEEALAACDELRPWMRREFGWPLAELGNIRLRKGDLAGAEEAFLAAHAHAWSPQPGLALLRLTQGDTAAAASLIADAIAHPIDIPSKERPPFGDLRLAPLLDAQTEIAFAAGDVETAELAAAALRGIADSYPSRSLDACAELAGARVAVLRGDHQQAIQAASGATAAWAEIGAPFEAASARMVLADALALAGKQAAARMEWQAAATTFAAFGAVVHADRAARMAAGDPPATTTSSAVGLGAAVFRCDSDTRTVSFAGLTALVHDLKGFRYIERLLGAPGREFHVLDLVTAEAGASPVGPPREMAPQGSGNAGLPVIDEQARRAYERRLVEVDEDIADAEMMNDLGRLELARRDRDYLIAELTQAIGLAGRHRLVGSTSERARTSVTRSIRYSLDRLVPHHAALAVHLQQRVRTGTYCVYQPDPIAPLSWQI
jgi:tetratricopeptide (TPR) repeat protein